MMSAGRILQGYTGMFGEIGHHIIQMSGGVLSETTRVNGIAEEYCSSRALEREYNWYGSGGEQMDAATILHMAEKGGDSTAYSAVQTVANAIAVLVINVCRVYDPEVVILGGGLSNSKLLIREIQAAIVPLQWSLAPPTFKARKAKHGNWAGALGSVKLSLDLQ